MECSKCHTKVLYCPCCGEKLSTTVFDEVDEDLEITVIKPDIQKNQISYNHHPLESSSIEVLPKKTSLKYTVKLVLIDDSRKDPEVFFLDKDVNLIGRPDSAKNSYPDVDLSFDKEGTISRYHAHIHKKEGNFFVEDLNSGNGTFLFDGNQLAKLIPRQLYPLKPRNRIRFGKVLMQFIVEQD